MTTNQQTPENSPLGKTAEYIQQYSPELLFPIPRAANRKALNITGELPFVGVDNWTAFEVSWLNPKGKPEVAVAEFDIPCESPNIIESKSLKLYLNSFNQTRFDSAQAVRQAIEQDLSEVAQARVGVTWIEGDKGVQVGDTAGYECIDGLDVEVAQYLPDAGLLAVTGESPVRERLVSHLLKSNCPVTGQPDWASLYIDYEGPGIDHGSLLQYIISFRGHAEFHEHCVEGIFVDITRQCRPLKLTVTARYLRRGGLDINPVRSTETDYPRIERTVRQ